MAPYETDDVKAEKANAMRWYHWQRKVKWVLELCAVLFVLFCCCTTWLPIAVEFTRQFFRLFIAVGCHLYVLMLIMALIFIIYVLSVQNLPENEATSDPHDEYVRNCEFRWRTYGAEDSSPPVDTSEETFHDKETVCSENVASPVRDDHNTEVLTITKSTASPIQSKTGCMVTVKAERYRRTKSEKLEIQIVERPRREFRRSESEICRKLVKSGGEPSRKSYPVNKLSDEEFNRKVDAFIAKTKESLREEYYSDKRKTECLAVVPY